MKANAYEKNFMDMIWLISCLVRGEAPNENRLKSLDPSALCQISTGHSLDAITAEAAAHAGIQNVELQKKKAKAVQRAMLFDAERRKILEEFEKNGIWHALLKGVVLQDLYPGYGLRQMTDNDILIDADAAGEVKDVMEKLGYQMVEFGNGYHDVYHKEPVYSFEMHTKLFAEFHKKNLFEYYHDAKSRFVNDDDNGYGYHLSPEDFYVYMIAHEYKHYSREGIGLRAILDTYLFLKHNKLDMDYVLAEMKKLDIAGFERDNRELSMHLFDGVTLNESEREMLNYVMHSTMTGSIDNMVANACKEQDWTAVDYSLHRFFVPLSRKNENYARFEKRYPLFYKYKILLPFLPFYRTFLSIKGGRFVKEAKAMKNVGKDENHVPEGSDGGDENI